MLNFPRQKDLKDKFRNTSMGHNFFSETNLKQGISKADTTSFLRGVGVLGVKFYPKPKPIQRLGRGVESVL
jgi:hypothetical protein